MWENFRDSISVLIYLFETHFYRYDFLLRRRKFERDENRWRQSDWLKK